MSNPADCNNGERQRITVTAEQASAGRAPCPKCQRVLGIVANHCKLEATLAPHLAVDPAARSKASKRARHKTPGGGRCWNESREPLKNGAGEVIGERCIGCGAPFAIQGRAGLEARP